MTKMLKIMKIKTKTICSLDIHNVCFFNLKLDSTQTKKQKNVCFCLYLIPGAVKG